MLEALTTSKIAMQDDRKHLEWISQNISNMHTTAYKKQWYVHHSLPHIPPTLETQIQQGAFEYSKHNLDLAIQGDGFFQIQTPEGIAYTRRGDFRLNNDGTLVNSQGYALIGRSGPIHLEGDTINVNKDGTILQGQEIIDQIQLAHFEKTTDLQYLGQSAFISPQIPKDYAETSDIKQGYLEQSNVKSTDEMMEMMYVSRHFSSLQKIFKITTRLLSKAVNELGTTNV